MMILDFSFSLTRSRNIITSSVATCLVLCCHMGKRGHVSSVLAMSANIFKFFAYFLLIALVNDGEPETQPGTLRYWSAHVCVRPCKCLRCFIMTGSRLCKTAPMSTRLGYRPLFPLRPDLHRARHRQVTGPLEVWVSVFTFLNVSHTHSVRRHSVGRGQGLRWQREFRSPRDD